MHAPLLQHLRKAPPFLRALMLAPEFALAITPAAVRDDSRNALIDAAGIDRDRAAKARADDRDALGIDRGMAREEGQRVARVLDLLEADHPAELALAVAAAPHAETQRHIAKLGEHLGGRQHVRGVLVAAEAMPHQEGAALLARLEPVGHAHIAGQLQLGGWKRDVFFAHVGLPFTPTSS